MGKGVLFLVLASAIVLSRSDANEMETIIASDQVRTAYVEEVLARELAHSAFNLVVAKASRDFTGYRETDADKAYGDGMYALGAAGDRQGPIVLTAYGEVGAAVHLIQATLTRIGEPILDAMTIDGPMASVTARGSSFEISGLDRPANDLDSLSERGADGHAIRTVLPSARDAFANAIDASLMRGKTGDSDVMSGPPGVNLSELESSIMQNQQTIILEGSQRIAGNDVYGSPEAPAIMVVNGDLTIRGTLSGYGILVVKGSFANAGNLRWEGLVMLSSHGGDHEFKGSTEIVGGLVIRSLSAEGETGGYEDAGLINGHFDVDVFNGSNALTYHQHQYDDRFDVTGIDLLSASCELDGGLCWQRQVSDLGLERVRIGLENSETTAGTFALQTVSSLVTGPLTDGLSQVVELADLEAFTLSFDSACGINGTSAGDVWADTATRNGQLRVKVWDIGPEDLGQDAILIHEVVAYRHSSSETCQGSDSGLVGVEPISFYINGNVGIYSSASALRRLEGIVPQLEAPPLEIQMTEMRQNSARTGL